MVVVVVAAAAAAAVDFAPKEVKVSPASSPFLLPALLPYNSDGQGLQMDSIVCVNQGPSYQDGAHTSS